MPDSPGRVTVIQQGQFGHSAYELAVSRGFQGTIDDWLGTLQGSTGSKGLGLVNRGTWVSGTTYNPNDYAFHTASTSGTSAWLFKKTSQLISTVQPKDDLTNWLEWVAPDVTTFLALTDTPASYAGQGLSLVRVNVGESGLEFTTGGAGDFISDVSVSVDSELTLFAGTTGKHGKRATGTGIAKLTSGVLSVITDSSTNWNTAFTDRLKWDGGATDLVAATGRTSLGLVIGTNVQSWDVQLDSLAGLAYTGNALKTIRVNAGETAFELATTAGGGGDFSSDTATSVVNEVVVFADTTGKLGARATGSGLATLTSGVLGTTANNTSNWDTAFTDRLKWDGGATGLVAATGRTSLGATTVGAALLMLADPGAVRFIKIQADNSVVAQSDTAFTASIGASTVGGNIFRSTNPTAITFLKANADNSVTWRSAANFKADLDLEIGTDLQAWDTQLDSMAGLSYTGNALKMVRVNAGETAFELATPSASVAWGAITGTLSDQTDLQTALDGKQPIDADLTTISGLTATTGNFIISEASAWASRTPAQARTTLGLVIGTNVQAWDADLDAWAAVSTSAKANSGANTDITSVLLNQTGLVVKGGDANTLTIKPNETLTAARTLNLVVNDAARTINLSGNLTVSATATVSGTNTGDQASIVGITGSLAEFNTALTGADFATGGGTVTGASSGTNTGDQASIVGITGTKAQFDTAVTDGNILYVGDLTQYTDELAQDSVGAMVDASLTYVDATPLLQRAALTGAVTASAGSNATALGSFTTAQLNTALSDNDIATGGGTASGTNTGDQTTIVGITGTLAQFNTAITDANIQPSDAQLDSVSALAYAGNALKVIRVNAGETDFELATPSAAVAWGAITGTLSNQTDLQTALDGKQPIDSDLTTIAGLTATTDNFMVSVSSAWASRTPSQVRTTLGLVIGTDVQAFDSDLTTWAGITPGANVGTFLATPSSANLRGALTDENGTGAALFDGATSPGFTTPSITGLATGSGVASAATASTLVARDSNANVTANNWLGGYTTTVTAAGTTTLTVGSTYLQYFTGSTTQTVTLPVVSTLSLGHQFIISNQSTGLVTVNSSGGNQVWILAAGTDLVVTSIATTGTDATVWDTIGHNNSTVSGKKTVHNNSLTYSGTDGTTLTFPTTSATIARTDEGQTFTGTQTYLGLNSLAVGTASLAPLNIPAGTLQTTPSDGDIEADANCFYGTTDAGNRGYISVCHIIRADATVTQANDANPHAIFTTPTNGRITLETGTYRFHGVLAWTAMSSTGGNIKVDILGAGTAVTTGWMWFAVGQDAAAGGGAVVGGGWFSQSATGASITTATTGTAEGVMIDGTFEVTTAGTVIPTQTLVTAAAAVLSVGSFIEVWRVGSTAMTTVGQWD